MDAYDMAIWMRRFTLEEQGLDKDEVDEFCDLAKYPIDLQEEFNNYDATLWLKENAGRILEMLR